jgi:hypothetical protein
MTNWPPTTLSWKHHVIANLTESRCFRIKANSYCIFHETCEAVEMQDRAFWVNPSFPRFVFPDVLPQFNCSFTKVVPPYHLCLIGDVGRQHFDLYRKLLHRSSNGTYSLEDCMQLWLMGAGQFPKGLTRYSNQMQQVRTQSYGEFELLVATECHVIMTLLDEGKTPNYFSGPRKLSGAIVVQVAVYQIPVVIHQKLYRVYEPYLKGHVETHSNDPDTFITAMRRMLSYMDGNTNAGVLSSTRSSPMDASSMPSVRGVPHGYLFRNIVKQCCFAFTREKWHREAEHGLGAVVAISAGVKTSLLLVEALPFPG